MPITQVGGTLIYYEEQGSGHPVLLIPGLSHTRLAWSKQIGPLSRYYRVITPDNRDSGDSALARVPYSITDLADDTAGLIQNLQLGSSYVIGWSMGGYISLELALRYPILVEKLVLVATSSGGPAHVPASPEIASAILPREGEDVEALGRRVNPLLAGPGYMQTHPEDLERMIAYAKAKPIRRRPFQRQMGAIMTWWGARLRLGQLRMPTLIVHGDADPLVPYENGRNLAANIPDAKFLTYPNVGHLLPIEASERFNQDVREFLR